MLGKRKLKFLQIHTFYDAYLDAFYSRHSHLADASFDEQINALLSDGFGANHMFAPYMNRELYESKLIIANARPLQAAWCRENGVEFPNSNAWLFEIVRSQIESVQPDVLYMGDPIVLDSRFMSNVQFKPGLTVGWRAAAIPAGTNWSTYDLLLSHLEICREQALKIGARQTGHFHPGIPAFIAESVASEPKLYDVVFTGGWTNDHGARNELLSAVALRAVGQHFSLGLFLLSHGVKLPVEIQRFDRGPVWAREMYRALKQGRIVINSEIDLARGEAGNSRLFETTATGSFLITEHNRNIERYFQPGREIETFKSPGELIEKIDHYLKHPDEREAIARRGQERCLHEYSMEKQCEKLDSLIRSAIGTVRHC